MPLPYRRGAERIIKYLTGRYQLGGLLPNDGYFTGVPKVIFHDQSLTKLTNGGNVGGGLDTIFTFSLLANSLENDGDILDIWAAGDLADNDNDKRIAVGWGSATIEDTGVRDIDALGWIFNARISRVSSTSTIVNHIFSEGSIGTDSVQALIAWNTGANIFTRTNPVVGMNNLNLNDTSFLITAEGTADDDIVINQVIITLTRFG